MHKNKKMIGSILHIHNISRWGKIWGKISLWCTHSLSYKVLIRQDILQTWLVKIKHEEYLIWELAIRKQTSIQVQRQIWII